MQCIKLISIVALCFLQMSSIGDAITLWSWDRLDDFNFIDNKNVRIAPLLATFKSSKRGVLITELRHQGFRRPKDIKWIAVFRIEIEPQYQIKDRDLAQMVAVIRDLSMNASEVQIDFDATKSQRPFYKKFMQFLQESLSIPISMTALASWCTFDSWLDEMPVSYAVPMLYNLGNEKEVHYQHLKSKGFFYVKKCRGYLGLHMSDLELLKDKKIKESHKIYLFNDKAWNQEHYITLMKKVE